MAYQHDNAVVYGVDGSGTSFNVLKWATQEAEMRNAVLEILYCHQELTYPGHRGSIGLTKGDARKVIDKALEKTTDVGVDVRTSLEADDPTSVLLAHSKRMARVVVGARDGSGGFADKLLRSVASALSARAFCAVVIVPSTAAGDVLPVEHIVCGVDGLEASKIALGLTVREAARWKIKLSYVSAINFSGSMWVPGPGYHREVLDDAHADPKGTVMKTAEGYDIDAYCHVIEGNPATLLAEFSTVVDMLVAGTRGRRGFAGLLLGSTSQAILHHSVCPTIIVPHRTSENKDAPWGNVPWSRTAE